MKVSKFGFSLFIPCCCISHKIKVLVFLEQAGGSLRKVSPTIVQQDSDLDSVVVQSDPDQCVCV